MFLQHKNSYFAIGAVAIVFWAGVLFFDYEKNNAPKIEAAATDNVMGFAWSENIGWISFNSLNCDTDGNGFIDTDAMVLGCGGDNSTDQVFDYGVNLNADNTLSGYAWSENIGWISFKAGDVASCPVAPCQPSLSGTEFSGWARALANGGGWDGWINLRNNAIPYGVTLNGSDFEGFAWSDMVTGWISFNCTNTGCAGAPYKVYLSTLLNTPPSVTTNPVFPINYCESNLPAGIELMWNFIDTEDDLAGIPQTGYEINLMRDGVTPCSIVKNPDNSNSITGPEINTSCPGFLDYGGHTYTWEVKVYDSAGADSGFVAEPSSFPALPTPDHRYPIANFSYSTVDGPPILKLQEITFDPLTPPDNSEAYGGASVVSFEWDFDDGTAPNPTSDPLVDGGIVTHFYSEEGPFTVDLKVTDDSLPVAHSCWASQQLNAAGLTIGENKTKWNETNP